MNQITFKKETFVFLHRIHYKDKNHSNWARYTYTNMAIIYSWFFFRMKGFFLNNFFLKFEIV